MQGFRDLVHGWFGKAVVIVVIALFALYGTDALMSLASKPKPVARVHDAELYREQLTNMVEQQKQIILRQNPGLPQGFLKDEFLRSQVTQRWVERQLIDQALQEWNVRPDQKTVISQLKSDSRFSVDGKINQQLLEAWLKSNGLTPQILFDEIRTNLSLDQLLTGLEASEFVVPKEVDQILNLQDQKRTFDLATIDPKSVIDEVKLSDEKIKAYYDDHLDEYMMPETAKLQYLVIDEDKVTEELDVTPSDAELQGLYENYKQSLSYDEKRKASHILISFDTRTDAEAQSLAQEVYQKIQDGEDFADLAKEYSDDKPSAEDGGELPLAERGTYVEPFEMALYSLKKDQVSEPVKTEFGYHLIKLDDVEAPTPVAFEDKKQELLEQFVKQKRDELFQTKLDDIEVMAFEAPNLEPIAEKYALTVQTPDQFSQANAPAPLNDSKVLETAFSETFYDEGRNSDMIQLGDKVVILFPERLTPAAPQEFASVKDAVQKAATKEAAEKLAADQGRDILAQLKLGKELTEDQQKLLGSWSDYAEIDRRSSKVNASVIQKLFAMAKPTEEKPVFASLEDQGKFLILKLNKVEDAASEDEANESLADNKTGAALAEQLKMSNAQSLLSLLVDALKDGADIEYTMNSQADF